jgi:ATP/maltotriose-dependent transcriptional regulator MalT
VALSADLTLLLTDAGAPTERLFADLEAAVPVLEQTDDYSTLALAEAVRFQAHDRAGIPEPPDGFSRALEYARRSGARHLEHYVMGWICITLHRGALPVDEAIARATEIHDASTSTYVRTSAVGAIGVLRAMKGEFDEARRCVADVLATLEELGLRQAAAAHSIAIAEVEALAGDDAAAERILRAGLDALALVGDEHSKTNVAWRLALVLAHQGRYDEADAFVGAVQRSEHHGFWIDVWWRVVLALVEARRGDAARARELVDEALRRMPSAEDSGMQVDALLESADALRATGSDDEAAGLVARAADMASRLGYVVAARRAAVAHRAPTA